MIVHALLVLDVEDLEQKKSREKNTEIQIAQSQNYGHDR